MKRAGRHRARWLFVDLAPSFGGHEVMILRWIDELVQTGVAIPVLLCLRGTRLATLARERCKTVEIDAGGEPSGAALLRKGQALAAVARVVWAMATAVRRWRPAVVVVGEGCLMAQRHGLWAAVLLRQYVVLYVPLVASFTEMGFPDAARLERRMQRVYGKLPDAWLTITPEQATELRAWSGVTQPVFCQPNTVSAAVEARFGSAAPRARLEPDGRTRVLVLGRLEARQKGLDLLLDWWLAHPALVADFELHLVGEGPFGAVLDAALQAHPALAEGVTVAPWADAVQVLCAHDVLLLPSRYEGVPLVMLEAMALGVPVVASELPGTRPYLGADCLFPIGDMARAFEILTRLHRSEAARDAASAANLRAFRARASGAAFSAAVIQLTEQVHAAIGQAP